MATISDNIRILRESRKWTKSEMAERLGLKSYSTISKWEKGTNHPKGGDLVKLCQLFGVTSDYLLGISDESNTINYYKYYPVAVAAGRLDTIDAINKDDAQWISIEDNMIGKYAGANDVFFIDVTGTSMNKIIKPNSRIGIKKLYDLQQLKNDDIVLFSIENEFSLKRFINDSKLQRFIFKTESTDDYHTDIVVPYDDIKKVVIHGKVILNISQYA